MAIFFRGKLQKAQCRTANFKRPGSCLPHEPKNTSRHGWMNRPAAGLLLPCRLSRTQSAEQSGSLASATRRNNRRQRLFTGLCGAGALGPAAFDTCSRYCLWILPTHASTNQCPTRTLPRHPPPPPPPLVPILKTCAFGPPITMEHAKSHTQEQASHAYPI